MQNSMLAGGLRGKPKDDFSQLSDVGQREDTSNSPPPSNSEQLCP